MNVRTYMNAGVVVVEKLKYVLTDVYVYVYEDVYILHYRQCTIVMI